MELNENQRELVSNKGKQSDTLNKILIWAEPRGDRPITGAELKQFGNVAFKIWECNRAIHVALENWIEGGADRFVKYGTKGGTDAWRRLCSVYITLAKTKQDIILPDILGLNQANNKSTRKLLNGIEELQNKYNQCGGQAFVNNIAKRALAKCTPRGIMKPFGLHLDAATTFQQTRKLIMRKMHDEFAGMLEGDNALFWRLLLTTVAHDCCDERMGDVCNRCPALGSCSTTPRDTTGP